MKHLDRILDAHAEATFLLRYHGQLDDEARERLTAIQTQLAAIIQDYHAQPPRRAPATQVCSYCGHHQVDCYCADGDGSGSGGGSGYVNELEQGKVLS